MSIDFGGEGGFISYEETGTKDEDRTKETIKPDVKGRGMSGHEGGTEGGNKGGHVQGPEVIEGKEGNEEKEDKTPVSIHDMNTAEGDNEGDGEGDIKGIGKEIAECSTVHAIAGHKIIIEEERADGQSEGDEEAEGIEAAIVEGCITDRESPQDELAEPEDEDYVFRLGEGGAIGQDMEDKVNVDPYGQ